MDIANDNESYEPCQDELNHEARLAAVPEPWHFVCQACARHLPLNMVSEESTYGVRFCSDCCATR